MNSNEIRQLANKAGFDTGLNRDGSPFVWILFKDSDNFFNEIENFAKLIAAKEREKTLQLWMLLDDVDTADDIAKSDDDVYRSLCRQTHAKRWAVLTGDEVDAAIRARGQE